jgi:DNA-binding NarL/FixJ family response regulator
MLHENDDHLLQCLTAREREIFALIRQGKSDEDIAQETPLRRDTVRTYRERIMAKLQGEGDNP